MVRIVAWNIRAGGGRRVDAIAAQITRWRVDVAALSEVRATPPSGCLAAALAGHGLRHQRATTDPAEPRSNRLLVASRWPLRRLGLSGAPEGSGRWLAVRVAARQPFGLAAMHVPNRVSGHKDAFHAAVLGAARRWGTGPALLVGDTNTGRIGVDEETPVFNNAEDRWMRALDAAGWRDAFRHLHGNRRAWSWFSPNGGNGFRIDQGFVRLPLLGRLRAARYAWGRPPSAHGRGPGRRDALSDHAALLIDLSA